MLGSRPCVANLSVSGVVDDLLTAWAEFSYRGTAIAK
jgi:hypothetical protein